jgi:thiamine-phosphate pyrophosphorylase
MQPILRILDANANRAREALRTLDDIARFVLARDDLAQTCKDLRHQIGACLQAGGIRAEELVWARDVAGDVGTDLTTAGESSRATITDIAHSAAGRLAESLRSMEESAKALGASSTAGQLEQARYASYQLHQRFVLALGSSRGRQFSMCVLVTESLCRHHTWDRLAQLCIEGGADCLQLREKDLPDRELLRRARRLVELGRGNPVAVFVNDRADIAVLAGATGVHLGQEDLDALDARRVCAGRLLVGVSTSTLTEARLAVQDGADLCGLGPMFPTATKQKPHLAGPAYVREYLADPMTARLPHLAIGGITPERMPELAAAGCCGVAVSSVVCGASDPRAVCELLAKGLRPPAESVRSDTAPRAARLPSVGF